jgi:hypothetical protein
MGVPCGLSSDSLHDWFTWTVVSEGDLHDNSSAEVSWSNTAYT